MSFKRLNTLINSNNCYLYASECKFMVSTNSLCLVIVVVPIVFADLIRTTGESLYL